jgi:hypothetical protein
MNIEAGNVVRRALLIVSLVAMPLPADAQVIAGAVMGSVTDSTGQPLTRAVVRLDDTSHGVSRVVPVDEAGRYELSDVTPAVYELMVSAPGFGALVRKDVTVAVDTTVRIDVQLMPAISQDVVVTASIPYVQTSAGLGAVLDRQRIDALPLNGRNFLQLALLTPGIQGPVDGSELSSRGAFAMHANGAREEFNNFLLDGVDNNDPYVNRYVVQPSVDSVQEFKVATNSYSAEYGRNAGGQVNVVTRRGSSHVQGFLYEYFRHRALDGRNYFEDRQKQPFTRHQFGGGIGGPLVRDRTFFFAAVDLVREREGLSRLGTVPTEAERNGDLSTLGTIVDPFNGQAFPGSVIPSATISPVARAILTMFPAPNRSGDVNYLGQPMGRNNQTAVDARVDHQLSSASGMTIRFSDGLVRLFEPYTEGTLETAGFGDFVDDHMWNAMVSHQRVNGRTTNSLRFGANGFSRDLLTENHAVNVGAAWGVNWLNVPAQSFGYPLIDVAGFSRVGDAFTLPILRDTITYQVADDLTIDRGSHVLKLGGEVRHARLNSRVDLFSRGQLVFSGAFTGTGIGDLLLGLPTFALHSEANNPIHMRTSGFAGYFQDNWRVRPDVTVSLGVRYEYLAPPVDANDGMSTFDRASGQVVQVGKNGVSRSGVGADWNNAAPRVGVSWNATPATIIRGGYGIYYDSNMFVVNSAQYFNPPEFNLSVFFPTARGILTLDDPFATGRGFTPPATISTLSSDFQTAYLQHWNVAVQRDLDRIGTVTAAYAGSKGSHLVRPLDLNQPSPGPGDVQLRRPYPAFSNIFFVESAGRSRFDSLQLAFDRPLTRGVSVTAAYTLSRSNDDASAFLGTPSDTNMPQDSRNPGAEWASSSYDVRHRLTLAYIVQLPGSNALTRNTQIQGITILHTGQPFTPILRFDNSNTGNSAGSTAGSDRPNLSGNPQSSNPLPDRWFNTAAFSIPAPFTFGNAGRNSLRGPGFLSFDLAIARQIRTSRGSITAGLQAFNLFNRANFDIPEHFADEPSTFGRIFSAKAPRQIQLLARFGF